VRLDGELKASALKAALEQVVRRHDILRATFHRLPGMKVPMLALTDGHSLSWEALPDENRQGAQEAIIEEMFAEEGRHPFDLDQGPLLRAALARVDEERHLLFVTLPALCADARTLKNLVRELSAAYAACLRGEELSDEPVSYVQFCEWQNQLLEGEEAEAGRDYWRSRDFSASPPIALPFGGATSDQQAFDPVALALRIAADDRVKIGEAAERCGVSVDNFLLAGWQVLFWRLTGQTDVVVGALSDGREHELLDDAVGPFAKWLPAHSLCHDAVPFAKVAGQLQESAREAYEWQDYFTWEPSTESAGAGASFPAVGFEFEKRAAEHDAAGVRFSVCKEYVCGDRFTIKLLCVDGGDSLVTEFHYDPNAVGPEEIKRLAGQYHTLLRSVVNEPDALIGDLEVLTSAERRRLLHEFNDTRSEFQKEKRVHHLFEEQASRTPEAVAVVFEEQSLTYAELNGRSNQLARHLRRLGIGPESPVALCVDRSLEMIVGMLGILKAGGAYVPIDPGQPKQRATFIVEESRSQVVLTQQSLLPALESSHASTLSTPSSATPKLICLDADWNVVAQESANNLSGGAAVGNLVYVIYTSGSTGEPKGVAVEHRQLMNYMHGILKRLELPAASSYATVSTVAADLGNTAIYPSLCTGGVLHVISQARASDPEALADYFLRHPIDCLKIVPSHLAALLSSPHPEQLMPRRRLVVGGEASRWDWVEKLHSLKPDCPILNHYGPTEATVGVMTHPAEPDGAARYSVTVPLGRPLSNTQIYVLGTRLQPLPVWATGELHIGGDGLARGYLHRPGLTAEKFIPDPFSQEPGARLYKTGDLARHLPDGTVEFVGRADSQVKFHGYRIELNEIKYALNRHPEVAESVIALSRDKGGNDVIVAYYVSRRELEVATLRAFLSTSILEVAIPNLFVHLKQLPLTSNGKIDYRALPTVEEARHMEKRTVIAPRTQTEEALASIWMEILGVEQVSVDDNFFDLGGHSLLATRVISQLRETFQVELPLRSLFASPTVASLARAITERRASSSNDPASMAPITRLESTSIDQQLAELDELSENEVITLLDPSRGGL
jgi:amino acid adenylation domain-containing protein